MFIQPRRDKCPDLIEHIRECDHKGHHHGHLHGHKERRRDIRGNHGGALGQRGNQWIGQDGINVWGPIHQGEKTDDDRCCRAHQTIAQLDQMGHKPLFFRLWLIVVLRVTHSAIAWLGNAFAVGYAAVRESVVDRRAPTSWVRAH